MKLSLIEACARLAITPRQLRYRIKEGSVKAVKVEGRWVVDEADLPRTPSRDRRELERAADLSQRLSDALTKRRARRRYSVQVHSLLGILANGVNDGLPVR